jgi:hypothetical protein
MKGASRKLAQDSFRILARRLIELKPVNRTCFRDFGRKDAALFSGVAESRHQPIWYRNLRSLC